MHRRVDAAFVVDTTGSMGGFINSAKRQMEKMLERLQSAADVDVRCVLIDYRDHPPQDNSYPAKLQTGKDPVTPKRFLATLNRLGLGSGGDAAESVLDGLDMLSEVRWRDHSRRIAFLVGDAPAHGYFDHIHRGHDSWPEGCPCGRTAESVTANLEECGIVLYGVVVSRDQHAKRCFEEFCGYTGGTIVAGASGMSEIESYLKAEFGQLEFDKQVLDAVTGDPDWSVHTIASSLGKQEGEVGRSIRRLLSRDLVPVPAEA